MRLCQKSISVQTIILEVLNYLKESQRKTAVGQCHKWQNAKTQWEMLYSAVCCTALTAPGDSRVFSSRFSPPRHPFYYNFSKHYIERSWQFRTHTHTRRQITNWLGLNKVTADQKVLRQSLAVQAGSDNMCWELEELVKRGQPIECQRDSGSEGQRSRWEKQQMFLDGLQLIPLKLIIQCWFWRRHFLRVHKDIQILMWYDVLKFPPNPRRLSWIRRYTDSENKFRLHPPWHPQSPFYFLNKQLVYLSNCYWTNWSYTDNRVYDANHL